MANHTDWLRLRIGGREMSTDEIKTHISWGHLATALQGMDELQGTISTTRALLGIQFTTPEGKSIDVPEGSSLRLHTGQNRDFYAIGLLHGSEKYGMTHGPTPELGDMLAVEPFDSRAKIICFGKDGVQRVTHEVDPSGTEWDAVAYDDTDLAKLEAKE